MTTPNQEESLYNQKLPLNLAATIHKMKKEYNEASDSDKEACLSELTGWLVSEKGNREYVKNKAMD